MATVERTAVAVGVASSRHDLGVTVQVADSREGPAVIRMETSMPHTPKTPGPPRRCAFG